MQKTFWISCKDTYSAPSLVTCSLMTNIMADEKRSLMNEVKRLMTQSGISGERYFHITRLADENERLLCNVDSQFCGFIGSEPKRYLREASLLDGPARRTELKEIGEPGLLVNDVHDYRIWLAYGGHGLVIESIARGHLAAILLPHEVAPASGGMGCSCVKSLPKSVLNHAPTKKTRMAVLTRDGRQCFICGRSPANYVDIELHVHHMIPWGRGGLTEEANLVTLCNTCHDGLFPHYDWWLIMSVADKHYGGFDRIPNKSVYRQQLMYYQRIVRRIIGK